MKRLTLLLLLSALTLISYSQRVYFLYIQSENEQPFYLKMQERVYSSASKGYLILSNLRDSSYNFSLGFPGGNFTEQKFAVSMNAKDHGYLLRNFNEKGWGLFDLQTLSVQMARSDNSNGAIENKKESVKKDESAFTQILAKASDDSTLLEKPDLAQIREEKKETAKEVVKQPDQKTDEQKPEEKKTEAIAVAEKKADIVESNISKTDSVKSAPVTIIKEETQPKFEETKQSEQQLENYKRSEVIRKSENSTTEGFGVTFIDEYSDGKKDTIQILIPQPKDVTQSENNERKEEKKFLDIIDTVKQAVNEQPKEEKTTPLSQARTVSKNNCVSVADENDFFKLRKKMAGIPEDDNMISEARRTFKTRCFSTEQIKNLSTLFLSDGGKYKFFDAAYEHVSDIENFPSLQSELKGEYFVNRFKAMLR